MTATPRKRSCCTYTWVLAELFNLVLLIGIPGCVWYIWPLVGKLLMAIVAACRIFGTHRVLRLPVGSLLCSLLALDLFMYAVVRALTWLVEATRRRHRRERALEQATSYESWLEAATSLDAFEGRETWCKVAESDLYDWSHTYSSTLRLREAREAGDPQRLMAVLLPCLKPNVFGVLEGQIYSSTRAGTKQIIEEFVDEVSASLEWLSKLRGRGLTAALEAERLSFLRAARASLGNPALLLSGGAILSVYQFGMVKALLELGMLPQVISGSSGGAVIGSVACCFTDDELLTVLREAVESPETSELYRELGSHGPLHGTRLWKVRQLLRRGRIYDWEHFHKHMRWFSKGLTFREAYERTGRVLNITCTPLRSRGRRAPPLMLNHIDTPHVDIASAVCASACVPGLINPVYLLEKSPDGTMHPYHQPDVSGSGETVESRILLRDGSFEADIPIHQIASKFGMSFAIVAQCNPHIAPFYAHLNGRPGRPSGGRARTGGWRGGFLLGALEVSLKEDMRKQLRTIATLRLDWKLFGCDWSHMWLQPQDPIAGVTLTIDPHISDYHDFVGNLTAPEIQRMVRTMERNTWEASTLMRTHMRVEKALASALGAVGAGGEGGPGEGGGGAAAAASMTTTATTAAATTDVRAAPRATPLRSPTRGEAAAAAAAGAAKREATHRPSRSPARKR